VQHLVLPIRRDPKSHDTSIPVNLPFSSPRRPPAPTRAKPNETQSHLLMKNGKVEDTWMLAVFESVENALKSDGKKFDMLA
jgi:hypothetical protein